MLNAGVASLHRKGGLRNAVYSFSELEFVVLYQKNISYL
jgi:hypothetical protein